MTTETQADRVVGRFPDIATLSQSTGISRSTIAGWIRSGDIPHRYWPQLLAVARELEIDHTPWDYIAHLVRVPIGIPNGEAEPHVARESTPA